MDATVMTAPQRTCKPLESLRRQCPEFRYESYSWRRVGANEICCAFNFSNSITNFKPEISLVFDGPTKVHWPDREGMDTLVFHLGLMEIPTYWKAACSPSVVVAAGSLTDRQREFWRHLLTQGMGEFHYRNSTPFTDPDFVQVISENRKEHGPVRTPLGEGTIVPIGGGKDSLVSLDFLLSQTRDLALLAISATPSMLKILGRFPDKSSVLVRRPIDSELLRLNALGYLNGHTPFGGVVGFISAVAGIMLGYRNIAVSYESSSNEGNLIYKEQQINHQYGKSSDFEKRLHDYLRAHIHPDLHYFSILRPFNELQIAMQFSKMRQYHPLFRSCNAGRKLDLWCNSCPKCLSTYLMLAPFLPERELISIFGENLLKKPGLQDIFHALAGEKGDKPFECVATPKEVNAAMNLLREQDPLAKSTITVLNTRGMDHRVRSALYDKLSSQLEPRIWPLLPKAKICILGLGVEGLSTFRFLSKLPFSTDITIIDQDIAINKRLANQGFRDNSKVRFLIGQGSFAQADLSDFDIIFKSPGIPMSHEIFATVNRERTIITSNTRLFFELCEGMVIGVTGTKGKSTTTSLIHHVLRASGKDARLIGNIGTACLDGLAGHTAQTIFCVEMSSFQLYDLHKSPHISVVLGIFPDHLDYYGSEAAYVESKARIASLQTINDIVLYNDDCSLAKSIAIRSPGRRIGFLRNSVEKAMGIHVPLVGGFNNYNMWPAIIIGRELGINDSRITRALTSFKPLPGRLEVVEEKDGIQFVCDIRSTCPEVTCAALEAMAQSKGSVEFLFLGGTERKQDYSKLLPALKAAKVKHILLLPPTGGRIRHLLEDHADQRYALFEPGTMEEALRYVYRNAQAERSICLLSTAAPSVGGLFSGPEDKMTQFSLWAKKLSKNACRP